MMERLKIKLPYLWKQREDQKPLWKYLETHIRGGRAVEVAHRQFGKDTIGMHFIACSAFERVGNYWHMLPKSEQCRTAIWTTINPDTGKLRLDEASPKELRRPTNHTEMKIDFINGSSYRLVGSDNYNNLLSSMPVGIVFSEWALANPLAWAYLAPMLEKNSGWALFISTSRGRNHLKTLYDFAKHEPGWFAELKKADQTPVFKKEQLETIRRGYLAQFGEETGEALFQQEYFCSFEGAILGSYYSKQMAAAHAEGRICEVQYQPIAEVDTFWDLGLDDSMSIWFIQHIGKSHHVIDYYENTGMGLEHYAKILKERGYNYGNHYMPHDAEVREMSSGEIAKTRREVAESVGIKPIIVVPRAANMDLIINVHIPAVRNLLAQCWFDVVKCARGISGLEGYHAHYDEDKKVMSNRPEHDHNSHACLTGDSLIVMSGGRLTKIKNIKIGDAVWTPRGYSKVLNAGPTGYFKKLFKIILKDGREIICTGNHKFFTQKGLVCADALRYTHRILSGGELSCKLVAWISMVFGLGFRESITVKIVGLKKDRAICIERFGNFIKGKYRLVMKFITEMVIPSITIFPTSKLSLSANINAIIPNNELKTESLSHLLNMRCFWRQNGTPQKLAASGISNTELNVGKKESGANVFVLNAAKGLCRLILRVLSFATLIAKVSTVDGSGELLYDLTIENHACYLANGMLVSNSDAFRTFAVGYAEIKPLNDSLNEILSAPRGRKLF